MERSPPLFNETIMTVPEVAKYLKISRSKAFKMTKEKELPSIKIGKCVRVRESDLKRYLDQMTEM
jgi:excisionase family DNA binding protein